MVLFALYMAIKRIKQALLLIFFFGVYWLYHIIKLPFFNVEEKKGKFKRM